VLGEKIEEEKSQAIEEYTSKYPALYYNAFQEGSSEEISKFDDINLERIFKDKNRVIILSGDFWGIQNFIFDGLSTNRATKVIRSRSALVQIVNFVISEIVNKEFEGDTVLIGAGKFTILANHREKWKEELEKIQKKLDSYFFENFFGRSGFVLSGTETEIEVLKQGKFEDDSISKIFGRLASENEKGKYRKFDFEKRENFLINPFEKGGEPCEFCGLRVSKKDNSCEICSSHIDLGKELTTNRYMRVFKNGGIPVLKFGGDSYGVEFYKNFKRLEETPYENLENEIGIFNILESTKENVNAEYLQKSPNLRYWSLASAVPKDENGKILDFDEIRGTSSGLMALKADVDTMGDTFREFLEDEKIPFKKFLRLSREMDFFFSDYVSNLIKTEYPKIYVVFTGGDDVFVLGEWKEVIEFVKNLREKFHIYSNRTTTLSMGLTMFKSGSLKYISEETDDAEKRAKAVEDENGNSRDGIDIFGYSMKFPLFLEIEERWKNIWEKVPTEKRTSSFIYRLIKFAEMSQKSKNFIEKVDDDFSFENFQWKSKLTHNFRRNVEGSDEVLKEFSDFIENYGEKAIPSIMMQIYRDREKPE
jgi:CRISPR-associated protein Csm1